MTIYLMNCLQATIDLHMTETAENGDILWGIIPGILILVMAVNAWCATNNTWTKGIAATSPSTFGIGMSVIPFPSRGFFSMPGRSFPARFQPKRPLLPSAPLVFIAR